MPRKSKEFLRRSRAAKKGWKTRRKRYGPSGRKPKPPVAPPLPPPEVGEGVELEAGYDGRDNSFSMTVVINPHHRNLDDDQIATLVEKLAQSGHFDDSENNPNLDLSWVFFNSWHVIRRDVPLKRGEAYLTGFARVAPGTVLP